MVGLHLPNAIGKTEEIIPRRANCSLPPSTTIVILWHAKRVLVTKIYKA
jgi:hypothetical protein